MQTEEFPKNPVIAANVKCVPCGKTFKIEEMLQEVPMPYPHVTVFEGCLVCPNCRHKVHSYYMSESLRHDQAMLSKAILGWQKDRTPAAWTEYVRRHRVFTNNYDRTQEKYKEVFAQEVASEQKSP